MNDQTTFQNLNELIESLRHDNEELKRDNEQLKHGIDQTTFQNLNELIESLRRDNEQLKRDNEQLKHDNEEIKHLINISLIDEAFNARDNVAKMINQYNSLYKKYTELLQFQESLPSKLDYGDTNLFCPP